MYKNKLSKRSSEIYPLSKMSLKAIENLQKELEARQTKSASILFRRKLLEHQNKVNYVNE